MTATEKRNRRLARRIARSLWHHSINELPAAVVETIEHHLNAAQRTRAQKAKTR